MLALLKLNILAVEHLRHVNGCGRPQRGVGVGQMWTDADRGVGVKKWSFFADVLYGRPLPLFDELCRCSINFARSCVSHESQFISQIASCCIHFARCNSPMGLNILFCADRFKTNIDGFLHGSSNYIIHSYYNRSIADVQLRAFSFLYELISARDSRQSYFGNVTVTKAELTDIINHICSS